MFQQIQAQTVIIIHPGSLYLRIGRASDLNPFTLINAIARRRLSGGLEHKDTFLPSLVPRVRILSNLKKKIFFLTNLKIKLFFFHRPKN